MTAAPEPELFDPVKYAARDDKVVRTKQAYSEDGTRLTRVQVVRRPSYKYPLVRIEETYELNSSAKDAGPLSRQEMVADHLLVTLKPGTDVDEVLARYNAANPKFPCSLRKKMTFGKDVVLIAFEGEEPANMAAVKALIQQDPAVASSEPDYIMHTTLTPNDPKFSNLWGLQNTGQTGGTPGADINASLAWDIGVGTDTVVVAVIDTGVDYLHPDLKANMWRNPGEVAGNKIDDDGNGLIDDVYGYDFVNADADPMDDYFHGTHCAGTIGAVGNNGIGVVGVNWRVKLIGLKFLDVNGSGSNSDAAEAIRYATQLKRRGSNIRVLSNSWGPSGGGGPAPGSDIYKAIDEARSAGILFVIAAGNDGIDHEKTPYYPPDYNLDNIICVAATDHKDALATFSCYGTNHVHLAAPGVAIWSTTPTNDTAAMRQARNSYPDLQPSYGKCSGTSMATPHVAGACAWVFAMRPDLTYAEVRSRIINSAEPIASLQGKILNGGRLDLFAAVPPQGPYMLMPSWRVDDSSGGNADGIINAGEAISILPTLWNFGMQTATQVVATLSLDGGPYLTLTQTNANCGNLASNEKREPEGGFGLQVAELTPAGYMATGTVSIAIAGGGHWRYPLTLSVWTSSRVEGHVYDAEAGGAGRGGALIQYVGPVSGIVTSAVDGAYAIAPLIDGAYALTVMCPGRVPGTNTLTVPPSQSGVDFLLTDPDLVVAPTNIALTVKQGVNTNAVVSISNTGTGTLIVDGIEPSWDVTWLTCSDSAFTIPSGATRHLTLTFTIGNADPTTLRSILKIYSNDPQIPAFSLPISVTIVAAPLIALDKVTPNDTIGGDGDGYLEPGESASLAMAFENIGKLAASGVSVTFSDDPYLTITSSRTVSLGSLSSGGRAQVTYQVTASADTPEGYTAALPGYSVDSSGRRWTHEARIPVMVRYSVSGRVTQRGTGSPLTNAWVYCLGEVTLAQSGTNGSYSLNGLVSGSHTLFAVHNGHYSSNTIVTLPPTLTGVDLEIDPAAAARVAPWGMAGGRADRSCRGVGVGPVEFANVTSYTGTVPADCQVTLDSDGTAYTKYSWQLLAHDQQGNNKWKLAGPSGFGASSAAPVIGHDGTLYMASNLKDAGGQPIGGLWTVSKDGNFLNHTNVPPNSGWVKNAWTTQKNPVLMPNGNLLFSMFFHDDSYVLPERRTLECWSPTLELVWRKVFTEPVRQAWLDNFLGFAVDQDNSVYATIGDTLYKLDANGQELDKVQYESPTYIQYAVNELGGACNPVVGDDAIFVCLVPKADLSMGEGWIIALDKNTLEEKWRRIFTDVYGSDGTAIMALGPYGESLIVAFKEGEGAVGGKPGHLAKLNAATGDILWDVAGVPYFTGGMLNRLEQIIVDRNGNVFLYALEDGISLSTGGTVRGYDGRDGRQMWTSDSQWMCSGISMGADGAIYQGISVLWMGPTVYRKITGKTTPPTNAPPVALATVSAFTNAVGQTATFSDNGSSDRDGWIVKWSWNFGDGTPTVDASSTAGMVQRAYGRPGDFIAILTVEDNRGLLNHTRIPIHVTGNGPSIQAAPDRLDVFCSPGGAVTQTVTIANRGDLGCRNLEMNLLALTTNVGQVAFTTTSSSTFYGKWLTPSDNGKFWLCSGFNGTTYKLFDPTNGVVTKTCNVSAIVSSALKAGWDGTYLWFATYKKDPVLKLLAVNPTTAKVVKTLPGPWGFQTEHHQPVLTTYAENALWVADTSFRETRICKVNPSNGAVLREIAVLTDEKIEDFEYANGVIWLWGCNGAKDVYYMVDPQDGSVLRKVNMPGTSSTVGCCITRGPNNMLWRRNRVGSNYFYELTSMGVAPWLKPNPPTGSIAGQTEATYKAVFNSTGLANGVYTADLLLLANDDPALTVTLPVTMTVGSQPPPQYTITASAGANGTVTPTGVTQVAHGGSQAYAITAAAHYHVADVLVDGVSVGTVTSYTFSNVTAAHTISASFAIDRHTLAVTSAYGTATPSGMVSEDWNTAVTASVSGSPVVNGTTQYVCAGWSMSGNTPHSGVATTCSMLLTNNATLTWQWTTNYWLDTASGLNGSVDVTDGWRAKGSAVTLLATASNGHHFVNWSGSVVSTDNPLTVSMSEAQSVTATFALNQYALTASAGANGTVTPTGVTTIAHGGSQSYTIAPSEHYHVADVLVDGVSVGAVTEYTFSNVTAAHTISASFAIDRHTLAVTSAYGTATPSGTVIEDWNTAVTASVSGWPVVNGTTQYVCAGWSMSGNTPHSGVATTCSMLLTNNATLTWQWTTNYWLETACGLNGSVDVADGWRSKGSSVTLLATASNGHHFVNWSGSVVSTDNPLTVTMSDAQSVTATFALNQYALTASTGANGTVTPSGVTTIAHGGSQTYTITAAAHYHVADVLVDGVSVGTVTSYTFSNVTAAHTISASFAIDRHTLAVTSAYGTATPSGTVTEDWNTAVSASVSGSPVVNGTTQYVCAGWSMSGNTPHSGVATTCSMLLTNNATLTWQWTTNYWLETACGLNGSVDVTDGWRAKGSAVTLLATASNGYHFVNWNGSVVSTDNPLTVSMSEAQSVTATFALNQYALTASAGANGTVTPTGTTTVAHGGSQAYTIAAAEHCHVADVLVDGVSVGAVTEYTLSDVTAAHTISASFAIDRHTLAVTSVYGTATPSGTVTEDWNTAVSASVSGSPVVNGTTQYVCAGWSMSGNTPHSGVATTCSMLLTNNATLTWQWTTNYWLETACGLNGSVDVTDGWRAKGSAVTLLATASNGYHFVNWNGSVVSTDNPLTVTMSDAQSVTATFALNQYALTASAGANGTVTPTGVTTIAHGGIQAYTIAAAEHYHVADVLVDGVSVGAVTEYTFSNVTAAHTISASFAIDRHTLAVTSAYGTATPSGMVSEDWNTAVSASVSGSPVVNGTTQYVCAGWSMSGNTPHSGVATTCSMLLTNNATLTWQWTTNYWLETACGLNGSVDVTDGWRAKGSAVTLLATASNGYHFVNWNGSVVSTDNPLTVTMSDAQSVTATFALNHYALTASAGANGTVTPTGVTTIAHGGSQTYTITPSAHYHVADVLVDGVSVGAVTEYTFSNVTAAHTISARFTEKRSRKGVPEWWFFLHKLTNSLPDVEELRDADGDGMVTWREYMADTDPTNLGSVLRLDRILLQGSGLELRWRGGQESVQMIERAGSPGGSWQPFLTNKPPTQPLEIRSLPGDSNRTFFYRIRATRP